MSQVAQLFECKEINQEVLERGGKSGRRIKEYTWKWKKREKNLKMAGKNQDSKL